MGSEDMSDAVADMIRDWDSFEGMSFPKTNRLPWKDHIQLLRQMKLREDDVFICTYPKSGTHWLWEIATMLRHEKAEYDERAKDQLMLEFVDADVIEQMPSPRILNSHLPFSMLPVAELKAKKIKVLHMYRNPKDSVVSYYHHLQNTKNLGPVPAGMEFKTFFEVYFSEKARFGCYFRYLQQMYDFTQNNPDVPVLTLSFEDMKQNPLDNVKRIAGFLKMDVSDSLCESIEKACRFDQMKKHADGKKVSIFSHLPQEDRKTDVAPLSVFFRKGQVGDWKNYLTVAMNERVDNMISSKMKGLPYKLQFTAL